MLAKSTALEALTIYAADGLTGQGLSSLQATSIHTLIVRCLDDATIKEAASLPLHTLGAACPSLTDAGLKHLVGTKLTLLHLTGSRVTEAGVKQLAAALPACRIVWDQGTIEPTVPGNPAPAE